MKSPAPVNATAAAERRILVVDDDPSVTASLGLLLNNASVIIGAMLVAPFMQPCIAFSIGMSTGQFQLARKALFTLLAGIPVALGVAALAGGLAAGDELQGHDLGAGGHGGRRFRVRG